LETREEKEREGGWEKERERRERGRIKVYHQLYSLRFQKRREGGRRKA